MLYNLLSNALKYSGKNATVEFTVTRQDEHLEMTVADKGISIPKEDHGHLFESFHRASNVSGIPGTGLGLNIAKRAVEAHGGTISYESQEGVGSAFMICLPLT
jgi:signal transduction histidine kinase